MSHFYSIEIVIFALLITLITSTTCLNSEKYFEHSEKEIPQFYIPSKGEIFIQIPKVLNLVVFRLGIEKHDKNFEEFEVGLNVVPDSGLVHLVDKRVILDAGDSLNYLFGYRTNEGYSALTGKYIFNGVHDNYSQRSLRNRRFASDSDDEQSNPEFQSRFGILRKIIKDRHRNHHHHKHHDHHHNEEEYDSNSSEEGRWKPEPHYTRPYYPPNTFPPITEPNSFQPDDFPNGPIDCTDRRPDICRHNEVTNEPPTTTTTKDLPDIDIRFAERK